MAEELKIVLYPDPRLKKMSAAVEAFDDALKELAGQMFVLMRASKGVGLAAPQVGKNIRLFVMNSSGKPEDDRVYVNPVLSEAEGEETAEEGCLSLPEVHVDVVRSKTLRIEARDLEGKAIDEKQTGYVARIWQHETDHLNGVLLTDRMGPVAKMTHRRILKELEEKFAQQKRQ
ncbi:MAG TPA: peptide deformylase [Tepidisphaeraceae bacterium]|nr:peptide deformylase [Tepidisphaeraceae bacterium]